MRLNAKVGAVGHEIRTGLAAADGELGRCEDSHQ